MPVANRPEPQPPPAAPNADVAPDETNTATVDLTVGKKRAGKSSRRWKQKVSLEATLKNAFDVPPATPDDAAPNGGVDEGAAAGRARARDEELTAGEARSRATKIKAEAKRAGRFEEVEPDIKEAVPAQGGAIGLGNLGTIGKGGGGKAASAPATKPTAKSKKAAPRPEALRDVPLTKGD